MPSLNVGFQTFFTRFTCCFFFSSKKDDGPDHATTEENKSGSVASDNYIANDKKKIEIEMLMRQQEQLKSLEKLGKIQQQQKAKKASDVSKEEEAKGKVYPENLNSFFLLFKY